jgi:predicted GNAT family N-acyltransferase
MGAGRVFVADLERDYAAIRAVRFAVFVDEQHVPAEIEMDERDSECIHVLAVDASGRPIGTGRLDLALDGKIGRMAVMASMRGRGVGRAILDTLHACAVEAGLDAVWCHAQVTAQPFYARAGYRAHGEIFLEADIPHVCMTCDSI